MQIIEVSLPERAKDDHQTGNSFSSKFQKKAPSSPFIKLLNYFWLRISTFSSPQCLTFFYRSGTHTDHYRNVIIWTNYLFKLGHLKLFEFPCRDEINRLTEILNSKVVSDVEREKERPSLTAEGGAKIRDLLAPEYPRTPAEGKKDVNRTALGISSPRIESNVSVVTFSITCIYQLNSLFYFYLYSFIFFPISAKPYSILHFLVKYFGRHGFSKITIGCSKGMQVFTLCFR